MGFDLGQGLASNITAATGVVGAASSAVSLAGNLANQASSVTDFASGARLAMSGLTEGAEVLGDLMGAISEFTSNDNPNDWRVRLSLAKWSSFKNSPVLQPLQDAGGLVFPYTPQITMKATASYGTVDVAQLNYPIRYYKGSDPGSISITAKMNVEDSTQALYWIAAAHYLRSLTHAFNGADPKAGNPPPIVFLNGYGNYVFKNVPVVLTSFSCQMGEDCDYIGTEVVGSAAGEIEGIADSIGGLADTLGASIPGLSGITSTVSSIAGGVGQVAGILGTFGVGGSTSGGTAYVPTKSSFNIELAPVYSRANIRKFSLDRFVGGGYLNSSFGYV